MLKAEKLSFRYPKQKTDTIDNLSIEFKPGRVYGLFGSNGVGKSTLLYLLAGLLTPLSGHATYDGIDTRKRLPETLRSIFIVPEELTLPEISLKEYVKINSPFYPDFSEVDFHINLATFEMGGEMNRKLSTLSMGQRKKVYMSFALACNTKVVLMDEPTNGLDIPGKAAFRRFIAAGAYDDRVILISTHQAHDVEALVDHVVIMNNNGLLLNESTEEISRRLAFMLTNDPAITTKAIFSQPVVGGMAVVIPNDGSFDTEINLETLFETVVCNPALIQSIFSSHSPSPKENSNE